MTMINKIAVSAALTLVSVSASAIAQAVPPATIVLVDMDDVIGNSTAGRSAQAQLQAQATAFQSRAQQLAAGFRTDEEALSKAQQTKSMAQPAFDAKVADLQKREQAAQAELGNRQRQLQTNQQYVVKQINDAAQPIITQVMQEKSATIALARGVTIQASNSVDVTALVLQRLNARLPSVQVNAPAAAAAPPRGR